MSEYIKVLGDFIRSLNTLQKWRFISILVVIAYCVSIWVLPDVVSVPVTIES